MEEQNNTQYIEYFEQTMSATRQEHLLSYVLAGISVRTFKVLKSTPLGQNVGRSNSINEKLVCPGRRT